MFRPQQFGLLLAGLAMFSIALLWQADANAGVRKSDALVKVKANAAKPDEKGKQSVTVTIDIDKGWHIYANPVNHEFLEAGQTRLTIKANGKTIPARVKYPAGRVIVDGKEMYSVYEKSVTIQAEVDRASGDTSPLELNILVQACNDKTCLQPGTVKLTVP